MLVYVAISVVLGTLYWMENRTFGSSTAGEVFEWCFYVIACIPMSIYCLVEEFYKGYIEKEKE